MADPEGEGQGTSGWKGLRPKMSRRNSKWKRFHRPITFFKRINWVFQVTDLIKFNSTYSNSRAILPRFHRALGSSEITVHIASTTGFTFSAAQGNKKIPLLQIGCVCVLLWTPLLNYKLSIWINFLT